MGLRLNIVSGGAFTDYSYWPLYFPGSLVKKGEFATLTDCPDWTIQVMLVFFVLLNL